MAALSGCSHLEQLDTARLSERSRVPFAGRQVAGARANLRALARAHLSNAAWTLSAAADRHYGDPWWPDPYIRAKTGRSESEARAELVAHNPQGRLVTREEVANAVLWLCLPGTESVTGQSIAVAGGEVM
jgi:NAD(P)-dependent dehydrogenase (short-subunit alcohol dehydrogenase family)